MKNEFKLQFALYMVIVLLLLFLSSKINLSFDFSENKIYSITEYTKNIFNNLNGTASITWIKSQNANKYFPSFNYLEDMFARYATMPNCTFEMIDAASLSDEALNGLGIFPEQIKNTSRDEQKINNIYSGVLIEYNGMTKVLPFVFNLQSIEYTIANNLLSLMQDSEGLSNKRCVYVLTFQNAFSNEYVYVLPFLEYDNFIPISVNEENLNELNPEIPLVVIGSSFIKDPQIQMIEKFLEAGGNAAFFVSGTEIAVQGNWKCTPKTNDKLLELLSNYGFIISQDIVFDIFNFPLTMTSKDGVSSESINYPFWLRVNAEQANLKASFFSGYNTLQMYWASSLDLNHNTNKNLMPVLTTSLQAKNIIENFVTDPFLFSAKDYANITPSEKILAAISVSENNEQKLFVLTDEYFLSRCIEFTNSDANIQLLVSVCQWLNDNENLLQLKNKAETIKPFKTFENKNKVDNVKTFTRIFNLGVMPLIIFLVFFFKNIYYRKTDEEK